MSESGFFSRLTAGLSKSTQSLGGNLSNLFTRRKLDAETIAALEDALIKTDMGAKQAARVTQAIARERHDAEIDDHDLKKLLAGEIAAILSPSQKPLEIAGAKPFVILVAGVNGTGKTTTIGKLARNLARGGHTVMLAAGDTFRAAAIEQLMVWGGRANAQVVSGKAGGDAAGLAFEALEKARAANADVLIVDTAGRLQNKAGLMDELSKIVRVMKKIDPSAPHASLLVLDATTGQNALSQVEAFGAVVPLTGLVMTKLDGTARGGILVALAAKFGLPIHYIGIGEGEDDLQPFDAQGFAHALTGASMGEKPVPRDLREGTILL